MLQRFHPHDGCQRQGNGKRENAPERVEPHLVSALRRARLVLAERPVTQPVRQHKPNGETKHRDEVEHRHGEQRLLGLERMINFAGLQPVHPLVNPGCQYRDGNEQRRHYRRQAGHVFDIAADGHRPTGIEQMVHQHQEQRTQTEAEEKHVGKEPRVAELLRVYYPAQGGERAARRHQKVRRPAPAGQIQRRLGRRFRMRAHTLLATKSHKSPKDILPAVDLLCPIFAPDRTEQQLGISTLGEGPPKIPPHFSSPGGELFFLSPRRRSGERTEERGSLTECPSSPRPSPPSDGGEGVTSLPPGPRCAA